MMDHIHIHNGKCGCPFWTMDHIMNVMDQFILRYGGNARRYVLQRKLGESSPLCEILN